MPATLKIKVVPGSSCDRVVGRLGDAIKIQVSAAPEDGKANAAVIAVLAEYLDLSPRQLSIKHGYAQPRKTISIDGLEQSELDQRLNAL
jgi:uncharacterized protein (TIGR00251 family)